MTQDQFCAGIRLIGGPARAAEAIEINQRAIERIMSGKETLGAVLASRLQQAVARHQADCGAWLVEAREDATHL